MVYYGVSMNTNFLGGDLYSTFIIGSLVEIPAVLVAFVAIDRIGRKLLLASGYTLAALCMLSNLIIGDDGKLVWLKFIEREEKNKQESRTEDRDLNLPLENQFLAHPVISMIQFVLAKAAIGCTYATLYAFTPELFPTVIRNIAMGCCSMMARFGAISASFIAMWLVSCPLDLQYRNSLPFEKA